MKNKTQHKEAPEIDRKYVRVSRGILSGVREEDYEVEPPEDEGAMRQAKHPAPKQVNRPVKAPEIDRRYVRVTPRWATTFQEGEHFEDEDDAPKQVNRPVKPKTKP